MVTKQNKSKRSKDVQPSRKLLVQTRLDPPHSTAFLKAVGKHGISNAAYLKLLIVAHLDGTTPLLSASTEAKV